jgi:hypothetical protein
MFGVLRDDMLLPPGYTLRAQDAVAPDDALVGATVTAYRGEQWIGEVSVSQAMLDVPGELQRIADMLTKRGVRR